MCARNGKRRPGITANSDALLQTHKIRAPRFREKQQTEKFSITFLQPRPSRTGFMLELTKEMFFYCLSSSDSSDWRELYHTLSLHAFGEEPEDLQILLAESEVKAKEMIKQAGHELLAHAELRGPYPLFYGPSAYELWKDILSIYTVPFLSFGHAPHRAEDLGLLYARIRHDEQMEKHKENPKNSNFEIFYFEPAPPPPPLSPSTKIKPRVYLQHALFYSAVTAVLWLLLWLVFFSDK